ncbi:hypothetical protein [Algoriphagus mannitolivorans]|uniref:hypothetical protein n=1 Tax=Algoriphagus mannitolivorans TaxID=226504 RepID=UPI000429FD41|nr:hypothetical protein [Algoriphagus mannitolivorans]
MKKIFFTLLAVVGLTSVSFAQKTSDLLHSLDGPMEVQVVEVGFNTIKYTFPNEKTIYSISKHQVSKIEFASGREEVYESPFKPVKGLDDWENVYITYIAEDVAGLNPQGELFSKATGVTSLSSINNVKNRALDKLKAEASMLGANIVYIGDVYQRGNTFGGQNQAGSSTQTTFSGMGYSSQPYNPEAIKNYLSGKTLHHFQTHRLNRNSWSPSREIVTKYDNNRKPEVFEFEEITERKDGVYVKTPFISSKEKELKVIRADENIIILMERNDKVITNYVLITNEHNYFKTVQNRIVL